MSLLDELFIREEATGKAASIPDLAISLEVKYAFDIY